MKRLCLFLLVLPLALGAEEKPKKDFTKLVPVEGSVVCLGCELEADGADAQCTLHSKHAQALKDGDGRLWNVLDNKRGHVLRSNEKLRGKTLRVHAWKYDKAQTLEVWKYEVKDGDKWTIYSYCDN
ncbi:MAG: hypothetical protein HYY18_09345 [Planctomycetes bacterium]|nr:hypothetical protein [Planctomycetota bacterium]